MQWDLNMHFFTISTLPFTIRLIQMDYSNMLQVGLGKSYRRLDLTQIFCKSATLSELRWHQRILTQYAALGSIWVRGPITLSRCYDQILVWKIHLIGWVAHKEKVLSILYQYGWDMETKLIKILDALDNSGLNRVCLSKIIGLKRVGGRRVGGWKRHALTI